MITVRLSGGMGNQMFQYALGRALSLKHNVPLALDCTFLNHRITMPQVLRPHFVFRTFDLDVFNIDARIANPADVSFWNQPFFSGKLMLVVDAILRKLAFLPGWEKSFAFSKEALLLGPHTYLEGFWQSEKYFLHIKDILKNDFTLRVPLSQKSQELQKEIASTISVCVHIRKGDISHKAFHGAVDVDYYTQGIEYIAQKQSIDTIYVFSDPDDIEWCKKNLKFAYLTIFVGKEYAGQKGEEHFVLMSTCTHFIIANSTFSWWAAWLANSKEKIVIVPKKWFNNKSINTDDLIPPQWVKI